jgi:hypothetical protein
MTLIFTDWILCGRSHFVMTVRLSIAQHGLKGFDTLLLSAFSAELCVAFQ